MSLTSVKVLGFEDLTPIDDAVVGRRNCSLGEVVGHPDGKVLSEFATTTEAYRAYPSANSLDFQIKEVIARWEVQTIPLNEAVSQGRAMFPADGSSADIEDDFLRSYREPSRRARVADVSVARPSSSTATVLPDASFTRQQETSRKVRGDAPGLSCTASSRSCHYRPPDQGIRAYEGGFVGWGIPDGAVGYRSFEGNALARHRERVRRRPDRFRLGLGATAVQVAVNPDEFQVDRSGPDKREKETR